MKSWALAGIVLVVLGITILAVGRFSYTTERQVAAVGPLTASVEEHHSVAFPDIAGFGLIAVGLALVVIGRRTA